MFEIRVTMPDGSTYAIDSPVSAGQVRRALDYLRKQLPSATFETVRTA